MRSWLLIAGLLLAAVACGRSGVLLPDGPVADDDDDDDDDDAQTPFCDSADSALLGCWRFSDDLDDASGNALVPSFGGITFDDNGAVGEAGVFSAASFLTFAATTLVVGSKGSLTIEAWIHPTSIPAPGSRYGIVDRQNPYSMFLTPGGTLRCGGREFVHGSGGIAANAWTHVACTDSPAYAAAYMNGVRLGLLPVTDDLAVSTSGRVHFGEDDPEGDDQFIGMIDELRIMAVALDSAAIAQSASRGP